MASSSSSFLGIDDTVDDFYFSVVADDDETDPNVPVSYDKYAEALQFQETVLASLITSLRIPSSSMSQPPPSLQWVAPSSQTIDEGLLFQETLVASSSTLPLPLLCVASSSQTVDEELLFEETLMASSSSSTLPPPFVASLSKAVDDTVLTEEADESSIIVCEICTEAKRTHEMFRNQRCYHSFCSECVVKQVATKIQDNITNVSCPGLNCKGLLELESCRSLLPKALIDRWDDALSEALLLTVPKFYCPFKDCSAMLLTENEGMGDIRESECPFCHRLFCARCYVPWHPGVGCEEYQRMNPDERGREDLLVRELANQKQWKRCPRCRFYVEKRSGCLHITCRYQRMNPDERGREDLLVRELANQKQWKRCPRCRFYVEKRSGCLHITCRCQFEFCYACGEKWTCNHGGCQRN